jgi:hypothetical protein
VSAELRIRSVADTRRCAEIARSAIISPADMHKIRSATRTDWPSTHHAPASRENVILPQNSASSLKRFIQPTLEPFEHVVYIFALTCLCGFGFGTIYT